MKRINYSRSSLGWGFFVVLVCVCFLFIVLGLVFFATLLTGLNGFHHIIC